MRAARHHRLPLLRPEWGSLAGAAVSTRHGGCSKGAWRSLNLATHVGDRPEAVAANREWLRATLGVEPVWLEQVHGCCVVRATRELVGAPALEADASWTNEPGVACAVMVADCLPVLMATADGTVVAAAHAGWRGLAAGVLETTLQAASLGSGRSVHAFEAWVGPCIGRARFEVGADVVQAFGAERGGSAEAACFDDAGLGSDGQPRWRADLAALAALRLRRAGVRRVGVHGACTAAPGSDFFSYRRDGVTGRIAALVWRA